jgi:hypothetical protein
MSWKYCFIISVTAKYRDNDNKHLSEDTDITKYILHRLPSSPYFNSAVQEISSPSEHEGSSPSSQKIIIRPCPEPV